MNTHDGVENLRELSVKRLIFVHLVGHEYIKSCELSKHDKQVPGVFG